MEELDFTEEIYTVGGFSIVAPMLYPQKKNRLQHIDCKRFILAPPQGLEPWTYGLTVRRSNQLS